MACIICAPPAAFQSKISSILALNDLEKTFKFADHLIYPDLICLSLRLSSFIITRTSNGSTNNSKQYSIGYAITVCTVKELTDRVETSLNL